MYMYESQMQHIYLPHNYHNHLVHNPHWNYPMDNLNMLSFLYLLHMFQVSIHHIYLHQYSIDNYLLDIQYICRRLLENIYLLHIVNNWIVLHLIDTCPHCTNYMMLLLILHISQQNILNKNNFQTC